MYSFQRLIWINVLLSLAIVLICRHRLIHGAGTPRVSWPALVPIALVALGTWLYFPTSEYVLGGKDPGTYMNEGIQIAQRGSLVVRDPVVAAVPPQSRDLFFPAHVGQTTYYGLRFVGFPILNPDDGSVIGQFPHLFPAAIAVGYGLNGLTGARDAVAVWAILGLLAVYFLAAHLVGRTAAAAATALLATNVIVVWFARYPNAEVMMQALVFAAMLAFVRAAEGSRVFFGSIAAGLLALTLFLRYDTILAFGSFVAAAALLPIAGTRIGFVFGAMLLAGGLAGFWYLLGPLAAYASYPLAFMQRTGSWWTIAGGLAALFALRMIVKVDRVRAMARRTIPVAYAAVLSGLAIYAYFFRKAGPGLAEFDAISLRVFGWYVTPWVLLAVVVGLAIVARDRFWRQPVFFATFAVFSVFFFYKTRIAPEHFWTTRRFLAVTLPGALIVLAGLASLTVGRQALARWTARRDNPATPAPAWTAAVGSILVVAVLFPVGLTFWRQSAPIRNHVEYAGLIPKLEQLAARVGDRDLLLVESRNAGSDLHMLALPLAYIYARNVLVLNSPVPDKRPLEDFIEWARDAIQRTCSSWEEAGRTCSPARLSAEPVGSDRFQVPEYAAPLNAYPEGVRQQGVRVRSVQAPAGRHHADTRADRSHDWRRRRSQRRPVSRPRAADRYGHGLSVDAGAVVHPAARHRT